MIILIGTGTNYFYRMFVKGRGTTGTITCTVADNTTSPTNDSGDLRYGEYFPTIYKDPYPECCDTEPFEAKKIIRYAFVWSLIAYAVILRKLIEQRSRAPPTSPSPSVRSQSP